MKENSKKRQWAINMTTNSMSLKMREVKDINEIIDFPDYGCKNEGKWDFSYTVGESTH